MGSCSHPHQAKDGSRSGLSGLSDGRAAPSWGPKGQLRHLREHQAFRAEVQAHKEVIMSVAKVRARPSAPALPQDGQWERP